MVLTISWQSIKGCVTIQVLCSNLVREMPQRRVQLEKPLNIQICYMQTADCFLRASTALNLDVDHSLWTQLVNVAYGAQELFQSFLSLSLSLYPLSLSPRASYANPSLFCGTFCNVAPSRPFPAQTRNTRASQPPST